MIIRLLAIIAAISFAGVADAQNSFSTPASACVPSDDTIEFNRHLVGNADVRHATGNVDQIVLVCPIARFNVGTTNWNLKLTYVDSTGTSTDAFVKAYLYQMAVGSATPVLLTLANSNGSAVTGLNTISSATFAHTFDFEANIYWVRVVMDRTLTNQTAIAHAIYLDGAAV